VPKLLKGTENDHCGGNRKRDESHLATHGGFLLLPRRDTDLWPVSTHGKSFGIVVGQLSATVRRSGSLEAVVHFNSAARLRLSCRT